MRSSCGLSIATLSAASRAVSGCLRSHELGEELEHLTGAGMPTGLALGVDRFSVDDHVEHASTPGNHLQGIDDVLVVAEQIGNHAHGVGGIVSGNAVGERDAVTVHHLTLAASFEAMNVAVIYESLTGNTKKAGDAIAAEFRKRGMEATASPVDQVDLPMLSAADLVVVGSWVDGLFVFGQKPGRPWRLAQLPVIDGKPTAVYCTFAVNPGKTLEKLGDIVARRGGDVIGGFAIRRDDLTGGAEAFVDRVMGAEVVA